MASTELTQTLLKALEAGNYNAAPSTLVQGSALQIEELSPVMEVVTFEEKAIKLQKGMKVESVKTNFVQFDRQLSYGIFGGSAQMEGQVGQEEDSQYARIGLPMSYYSHMRRVTDVANMVATVDGVKAEDRASKDAAIKLAADIEFDIYRGRGDFSNAGVFDGSMRANPTLPNIMGLQEQVRMSDLERNAQDQMFAEYGSNETVVVPVGGVLSQDAIEDAHVKSQMNHGDADILMVDPKVLSAYNKISFGKERIVLAGSPQDATGAQLKRQWVSNGTVDVEASRFLSGKTAPASPRNHPSAPSAPASATSGTAGGTTSLSAGDYTYFVTACNEVGESRVHGSAGTVVTVAAGDEVTLTITPGSGTSRYFNVYRTAADGPAATAKFIGRVANSGAATTDFVDLGNKKPGFVTGTLIQKDTFQMYELCPFSSKKLAVDDLSNPVAYFRFACLGVKQPRKNILCDNLTGSF